MLLNKLSFGMKLAISNHRSRGKKTSGTGEENLEVFMQAGVKLNLTRTIRSSKTGMILPKEGTLVAVTENLGRTLLFVEFENGQSECLFENEVEFQSNTPSHCEQSLRDVVHN
jgi:hypothetical protein